MFSMDVNNIKIEKKEDIIKDFDDRIKDNRVKPTDLYVQVYQDRLADIQIQLQKLQNGTHNEYVKQLKVLELQEKNQLIMNNLKRDSLLRTIEIEFIRECGLIYKEFTDRKNKFSEDLKKNIEHDILNMELFSDSADQKLTKKLRSRPNHPVISGAREKRCKPLVPNISYSLQEHEIEQDVMAIQKSLALLDSTTEKPIVQIRETVISSCIRKPVCLSNSSTSTGDNMNLTKDQNFETIGSSAFSDTRIEDGKLLFKKRWYHRGQTVFVEGRQIKFIAIISAIGNETILVQKISGHSKFRINLSYLSKGKMTIRPYVAD